MARARDPGRTAIAAAAVVVVVAAASAAAAIAAAAGVAAGPPAAEAASPPQGPAGGQVAVLNDRLLGGNGGGGDGDGALRIAGEIRNGLGVPLRGAEVTATLYSDAGQAVGTYSGRSMVDSIVPGMSAPFVIDAGMHEGGIGRYALDVGYEVAGPKGRVIDVTSSSASSGAHGIVVVAGTVVNNGDITANEVSVVATLYDRDGNVLAASAGKPDRDYLRASEEAFFVVSFPGEPAELVAAHAAVAESEEYAAVPEFPLGAGALLAASVIGYVGLSRYWGSAIAGIAAAAGPGRATARRRRPSRTAARAG